MSDCYCDYETPAFYFDKLVKARNQHKCSECGKRINKDEIYERVNGKWDDRIDTYKTCSRCLDLRNYTKQNVKCLCWCHENMIDDCIETLKEYKRELPGLLFGGYRLLSKIKSEYR